jgi:hypothetical protein
MRPLVAILPRQPGSREARYAQLLTGSVESAPHASPAHSFAEPAPRAYTDSDLLARIAKLEAEVAELKAIIHGMDSATTAGGRKLE